MSLSEPVPPLQDCRSCHRLDSADYALSGPAKTKENPTTRAAGAYMLPVTYENDCRACHPLKFDDKIADKTIPHGLSPRETLDLLRQLYKAQAVEADPSLLRRFVPPRPRPGQPSTPAPDQIGPAVDKKVLTAVKILFGSIVSDESMRQSALPLGRNGCALCHHFSLPVPLDSAEKIGDVAIEKVQVPEVWFQQARFDHSAHRALDCKDCHAGAERSKDSTDVLLPGIRECTECHGPSASKAGKVVGGAGDSCTECHRFHNGDHPLEGIGASSRGVNREQRPTIDQFLQGLQQKQSP
jgi:hypothetical protein